jgi:hypothetical protein
MNPNQGQVEAWNGGESVHYVSHADRYDRQLAPFTEALLEQARIGASDTSASSSLMLRPIPSARPSSTSSSASSV